MRSVPLGGAWLGPRSLVSWRWGGGRGEVVLPPQGLSAKQTLLLYTFFCLFVKVKIHLGLPLASQQQVLANVGVS